MPANNSALPPLSSMIAGSVLPIQRAEELLATLPGVMSAHIVAGVTGAVDEIHILTTTEVTPKQTVRNVESALIAHLGMRVSHKKISVATSDDGSRPRLPREGWHLPMPVAAVPPPVPVAPPAAAAAPTPVPAPAVTSTAPVERTKSLIMPAGRRRIYFEDVEVRRSRSKGIACRVTLRKGEETFIGEAEGVDNERLRIELAARAALAAIRLVEGDDRAVALEGCKLIDAFERQFVFVALTTREGRDQSLTTGSAEVRESPETASVLAVLDATNRWLER